MDASAGDRALTPARPKDNDMHRSKLRIAILLAALTVAMGGLVLPGSPAMAAAACNGSGCTGRDPQAQGCSPDSRTIDEFTYLGARFELRYSPACFAAWTRVTSPTHFNTLFAQIRTDGNTVYGVQVTEGQHWTQMINFAHLVRACHAVWFDAAPNECTAFH